MANPRASAALPWIARALVLLAFLAFLRGPFRTGWTTLQTDFPNYYTAAVAVRHHEPLRDYYDWTWFARQMSRAGIDNQLGAYAAQTPLTMLPIVPLAGLREQQAKRVWLIFNLALLAAIVAMLARLAQIRWEYVALLLAGGYRSLESNFIYGQYYVFLLFLIVLVLWLLTRQRQRAGGFLAGIAFGLKLYTGPMLLYFAARRKWPAVAGMLAAIIGCGALAVAVFGWSDVAYYLTHVLPRSLEGGSIDPYNPANPTLSTLLHKLFLREPELNPSPGFDAPWAFFFLRTLVQLSLITFVTLAIAFRPALDSRDDHRPDFACFVIALVLLSTSTASYTFILLLAPVALLLRGASLPKSLYLVLTYILLNVDLQPVSIFPKLWLLLILFFVASGDRWRTIPPAWAAAAAAAVFAISGADAWRHLRDYSHEPGRRYSQIAAEPGALFFGYPAITREGLFYQGWGDWRRGQNKYVLRWLRSDRPGSIDSFDFDGDALRPVALAAGGPIEFELAAHGGSTFMQLDPRTGKTAPSGERRTPAPRPQTSVTDDAGRAATSGSGFNRDVSEPRPRRAENSAVLISPDGKYAVLTVETRTSTQLWLRDLATATTRELAGGYCNNSSPVWELDSSAVIFASDCGRAYGLPALYRAPLH